MKNLKRKIVADRGAPPSRQRAARARATDPVAVPPARALEGHVVGVDGPGVSAVSAILAGGEAIQAACPAHVDARWLAAASRKAPVAAIFVMTHPSRRYVLWGLFPGTEHADVRADLTLRGRHVRIESETAEIATPHANVRLETDGNVTLKGRDVTSHARRVNRIKGGAIRLN